MAKVKKVFICSNCGANSPKWIGKCSSCEEWNTYQEEVVAKPSAAAKSHHHLKHKLKGEKTEPTLIDAIEAGQTKRIETQDEELDRVLGGGIVNGSLILIGGQPGIGKSTLMLQIALRMDKKILYVSGEESEEQIKLRADRIEAKNDKCWVYTEVNVEDIVKQAQKTKPDVVVIDSIQTLM